MAAGRLRPNTVEPQRALAVLAERNGNNGLLNDASAALVRIEPNAPEGYLFQARAAFSSGDTAGAEKDINKAIAVAPSNSAGYLLLAELRLRQKRLDEAEKLYEQALKGNPSDGTALSGLINIDLQHKDVAKALRRVQDQIARVPNNSSFYLQASGRNAINKELNLAHANLIWSPVAFVDLGVEGAWGHRVTVSNLRGDAWTMQTSLKFRF